MSVDCFISTVASRDEAASYLAQQTGSAKTDFTPGLDVVISSSSSNDDRALIENISSSIFRGASIFIDRGAAVFARNDILAYHIPDGAVGFVNEDSTSVDFGDLGVIPFDSYQLLLAWNMDIHNAQYYKFRNVYVLAHEDMTDSFLSTLANIAENSIHIYGTAEVLEKIGAVKEKEYEIEKDFSFSRSGDCELVFA